MRERKMLDHYVRNGYPQYRCKMEKLKKKIRYQKQTSLTITSVELGKSD